MSGLTIARERSLASAPPPQDVVPFAVKTLKYGNASLSVAGAPGDAYFDTLEHQLEHCGMLAAVLFHHLRPGAVIIDVGANVGLTTVLAHHLVDGARIVSIEPSRVYEHLVRTVALNHMARQSSLRMCAGASDGETLFVEATDSSASHMTQEGLPGIAVPVRRLDTIVREQKLDRVDFVKIDVEGFEMQVLDGMTDVIARHAPLVMMEFNSFTLSAYGNCSPRAVLERVIEQFGGFIAAFGAPRLYKSEQDVVEFLAGNMLSRGCVDDIVFSSSAERIAAFALS